MYNVLSHIDVVPVKGACIQRQLTFHDEKCQSNTCKIYSSTLRYTFQCKYELTAYGVEREDEVLEGHFVVRASPVYILCKVPRYYACCNAYHCLA